MAGRDFATAIRDPKRYALGIYLLESLFKPLLVPIKKTNSLAILAAHGHEPFSICLTVHPQLTEAKTTDDQKNRIAQP
jgi:hypothetical protein